MEIRTKASGGRFGAGNFTIRSTYLNGKKTSNVEYTAPTARQESARRQADARPAPAAVVAVEVEEAAWPVSRKTDYYKWLDANFGSIKILREMDAEARKELGGQSIDWMVDQLATKKITDESIVATYMNQTGWFKKYGAEASLRLVAEKQRPGFFKQQMGAPHSAPTIRAALGQLGVNLSEQGDEPAGPQTPTSSAGVLLRPWMRRSGCTPRPVTSPMTAAPSVRLRTAWRRPPSSWG